MKVRWISVAILLIFLVGSCNSPLLPETVSTNPIPTMIIGASSKTAPQISHATDGPVTGKPTSKPKPMAITVEPPMVPISTAMPVEGWQTYTSIRLGVIVDYPFDWSVTEEPDSVIFISPQGKNIQLNAFATNSDNAGSGDNNQQCATLINSHGLSVETCVDTSTRTYSAKFSMYSSSDPTSQWLLLTTGKDTLDVYLHMLDSLHSAQ